MKAKFLTLLAAAIIASGSLFAQEKKQAPTPEQIIEKRTERMQKKLELDDATAAKFAPIYKDYLKAKAECRSNCKKCENPTEEQIKENISKRLEAQEKAAKVEKKYYKKTTLQELDIELDVLRHFIRLAQDKRYYGQNIAPPLSFKKYENWSKLLNEIGRIIGGYMKHVK